MADPISIASGLVALAAFALQSSKTLYQLVESFKSNRKVIRELKEELEALHGVLQSLHQAAGHSDADLTGLKLPVVRCGKACTDFEKTIVECTAHSGGSRTSFRDWAKLKYMGNDIVGFKNMLAGYKSTISIALGGANLSVSCVISYERKLIASHSRTAAVTIDVLNQYQKMITNTTSDLEEHLQEINDKLQTLSSRGARVSDEDMTEREQIQEEMDSTKQCLSICAQVSKHMDQVQSSAIGDTRTVSDMHQAIIATLGDYVSARRVTSSALKQCKERLANTTSELEGHLQKINSTLETSSRGAWMSSEHSAEHGRIQEEKTSVEQCLEICTEASQRADQVQTNIVEDVSATHDAHQVVVATLGDLITARRITAGNRSMQWLGQMSDATLQQLSRDRGHVAMEKITEPQSGETEHFENQYGTGKKLRQYVSAEKVD